METCDKCNKTINDNAADNYECIHFICDTCFNDSSIRAEWEKEKEHYAVVDYSDYD